MPVAEWRRLQAAARPSLKQLLLADEGRWELRTPARVQAQRRRPTQLGQAQAPASGAGAHPRRVPARHQGRSELRKPRPHGAVVAWVRGLPPEHVHISAVTVGEIQAGIGITREQDPVKAREIETWLESLAAAHNVLALDAAAFRIWVRLMHRRSATMIGDALIAAATALRHRPTVATRNPVDFQGFGVAVFDPFEGTAPGSNAVTKVVRQCRR